MLEHEPVSALSIIEGYQNPEIHHYHQGSHPGIRWYIKTILPDPSMLENAAKEIWDCWQGVFKSNRRNVRITDSAYSWNGQRMPGWHTVWLDNRIDIEWQHDQSNGFSYSVIDYDSGLKNAAARIESWIAQRYDRHSDDAELSYEKLSEIVAFLKSYTSDNQARKLRSKLRMIDDNEI